MLKKPKFELGKLMVLYGEGGSSGNDTGDETGAKVEPVLMDVNHQSKCKIQTF